MKVRFLCIIIFTFEAFSAYSQSTNQYLIKAEEFIKDYVSQLNLILDPKITHEDRLQAKNVVLDDMINSREETNLYDNISDKIVINNHLPAQTYFDRLFILFNNQMPLKSPNENYVNFQIGEFKSDSVYIAVNKIDKICIISRIINLDSLPIGIQFRSDTISFAVQFKNGDLDDRRILSSNKYTSVANTLVKHNVKTYSIEQPKSNYPNIKSEQPSNPPVEKQIKIDKKERSTIELPISFNLVELKAMDSEAFEISYSNMPLPSNPELVNLETIVFQVNINPSKVAVVTLKKFIFKDETKINLVDLKNEHIIDERVEIITKYTIRLSEQNELQSYLQLNGK